MRELHASMNTSFFILLILYIITYYSGGQNISVDKSRFKAGDHHLEVTFTVQNGPRFTHDLIFNIPGLHADIYYLENSFPLYM